jgi:hypothetical protein
MITTKGYLLTVALTTVLPENESRRGGLLIQNNTTGVLGVIVGTSTTLTDAIYVMAGASLYINDPIGSRVSIKCSIAGYVTIMGDNLP